MSEHHNKIVFDHGELSWIVNGRKFSMLVSAQQYARSHDTI